MISTYYFKGHGEEQWEFEEITLSSINLFVGATGSGKTRFLNTLFNVSTFVAKGEPFRAGYWKIAAQTDKHEYRWEYQGITNHGKDQIVSECLRRRPLNSSESLETLIDRTSENFLFCGNSLPKLQSDKLSLTLLKEEKLIEPFYETFLRVQRRNFHDAGLNNALSLQLIGAEQIESIKSRGITALWEQQNALSAKLFLLKNHFPDLYQATIRCYKEIFPTLTDCNVVWSNEADVQLSTAIPVPIFLVQEKGVKGWMPLNELSSGMQKVLLILSDIISLPKGTIYIIDEYENSLGVNAIDFLPQFLVDYGERIQFLITTHHPYLINSIPVRSWRVFHREGSKVMIRNGAEFEEKYGKSKQQAFIQLINDPFYAGTE